MHAYVFNSPTNATDPSGLYLESALDIAFIGYDIYALVTGGRKDLGMNTLALGLDVAGLLLPGVTGLGALSRGLRLAEHTPALRAGVTLTQGNRLMGLEHIVLRHWHSSGVIGTSKFGRDIGAKELRELIDHVTSGTAPWRIEGTATVLDTSAGRIIGTDAFGRATEWVRVVVNQTGEVVTAYPIPRP